MMSLLNRFVAMPRWFQAGLAVALGGSVVGSLYMLLHGPALLVLLIGVAVVAALLVLYRAVLKRARRRKAARMEKGMAEHASAGAVAGAPAERARMDDLRRSFEEGVAKFKAAGKNIYELPWYVIVGESGSGKTEAIRHSSIGFPPGLQDRLQGAGGTINMNWWFAEDAVLLDTAGRLMFEESGAREWREFLRLLKTHRGNCPINGMLL
ncbi:MAG: hypothetical protein GX591_02595, partial [Planctomycetes bacterium]|nr:hypothetical protein [Planctomycetota bacterium]